MRRTAIAAASIGVALLLLASARLAGGVIRAPEITYSPSYGRLHRYDLRFDLSMPLVDKDDFYPVAWAWSPDGTRLGYMLLDERGIYHLEVWSPLARHAIRIASGLPFGSPPQWSPDSTMIADVNASQDICLYPSAGGPPRCLNVQPAGQPSWSPDGRAIVYISRLPQGGLSRIDLADGRVTVLVSGAETLTHPRWSPDGRRIVFAYATQQEGLRHLYLVAAEGGAVKRLTAGRSEQDQPVWSPDGRLIAYRDDAVQSRLQADVAVIEVETGEITRVTSHPMNDADPRWSPDGRWLAFVSDRYNSAPQLMIVPVDGLGDAEPLHRAGLPMALYAYAWRP